MDGISEDLRLAVDCLNRGGIILYPTDTIWGIGCDATNENAVKRVFELKKRSDSKSMLVLVDGVPSLERIVDDIPEVAYQLIESAVNPVTVIYDKAHGVAPSLIADDGSLGVRITNEKFSSSLCRMLRKPLVSTSANISGEPSPAFFHEISPEVKNGVDYIVSFRRDDTAPKKPSNIIKIGEGGLFKILR